MGACTSTVIDLAQKRTLEGVYPPQAAKSQAHPTVTVRQGVHFGMKRVGFFFAEYSVDELAPLPSCDLPSKPRKNSLSTEERAKFDQFHAKMYTSCSQAWSN